MQLLKLKWRHIPRLSFYVNMLLYLFFLVLFSLYCLQLALFGEAMYETIEQLNNNTTPEFVMEALPTREYPRSRYFRSISNYTKQVGDAPTTLYPQPGEEALFRFESVLTVPLLVAICLNVLKLVLKFIFIERASFFASTQNWCEMCVFLGALYTLISSHFEVKAAYGSLTVMFAYIVFTFLVQKVKV